MKILFSSGLYPKKVVESSAADFAALARFQILEKDGIIEVEAIPEAHAEVGENFADEFSNYVLGQMA
jgi:hypothetical protein